MNGIFFAFAVIVLLAPSFRWENLAGGYVESVNSNNKSLTNNQTRVIQ